MYFRDAVSEGATWAVVATCREPSVLTLCFVTHHLALGAAYVELYLDAPEPAQEAALARIPGCRVTVCDEEYWQETLGGTRPPANEKRQLRNAARAYARAETDWLVHLDADEFIEADLPLASILDALPDRIDFLHLPNLERVFDATRPQEELFDGYMRAPLARGWPGQTDLLDPDVCAMLHRGVVAHSQGKSAVRTGRGCLMGIHSPRAAAGLERLLLWPATTARVLHYDGLTGFHWIMKLLRGWSDRGGGAAAHGGLAPARQAQIGYVDENRGDMFALLELHQKLKALVPADLHRLETLGLLRRPSVDPGAALRAMGQAGELSVRAFDDALSFDIPDLDRHRTRWRRLYRMHFEGEKRISA
ncbi:glycosyltransferase family 2 protein [Ruegeria marina]|nr:glycosyltransferase family 2 protein [Ruegeria marina]